MYKAAGLDMSSNYTDLPDHIAAEMEFMQFLCAEESKFTREGKDAETKKVQTMERDFLNNHIEPWVSEFADCVLSKTNSPFYKLAASLLKTFTKNELNQFAEGGTR
jgi:TorA maturation chaperone TorD